MPTTSRSRSAIFRSTFRFSTARHSAVDRLEPLHRRVEDLERRDIVDADERPGPPLAGPQLVEHAVLRHLEHPGREPAPQREVREALEDPDEDLLREVFGERPVADQAQDVVVDREARRRGREARTLARPPAVLSAVRRGRAGGATRRVDCSLFASPIVTGSNGSIPHLLTKSLPVICIGGVEPRAARAPWEPHPRARRRPRRREARGGDDAAAPGWSCARCAG